MSTAARRVPMVPSPVATDRTSPEARQRALEARRTMRRRLITAMDALAVADLLLGMNRSIAAVEDGARRR